VNDQNIHTQLLNTIYQTSSTAFQIIDNLEIKMQDETFKTIAKKHRTEYKQICDDSIGIFIKYGKDEKEVPGITKLAGNIINMIKTIKDDSTSNIAKILTEEGNKGLLNLREKLNKYNDEDKEIVKLAEKLIKTMEENIDNLKEHL